MTQDNSFLQHALQCINEKDLAKAEEILSQALEHPLEIRIFGDFYRL